MTKFYPFLHSKPFDEKHVPTDPDFSMVEVRKAAISAAAMSACEDEGPEFIVRMAQLYEHYILTGEVGELADDEGAGG